MLNQRTFVVAQLDHSLISQQQHFALQQLQQLVVRLHQRMNVPYVQTTDTELASTVASVQKAFDAREVEDYIERVRMKDVITMTGISRTSIYKYMKAGTFPQHSLIGNAQAWRKTDIIQWLEGKRDW